jgi:asparagine synthase (glutamine-hydrolysing)
MLRYLGMMWNDSDPQQHEASQLLAGRLQTLSPSWQLQFAAPGIRVFCADGQSRVQQLPDHAGVIIGSVFARSRDTLSTKPDPQIHFDSQQTHAIVRSRGRWLIENSWGNYVAFARDAAGGCKWVLKDPTGTLPCLRTQFRGVTIFFSRMADCVELRYLRFTVNERFLNSHLVTGSSMQNEAALNEVSAVRRGECVQFENNSSACRSSSHSYWSPLQFSGADDLIEDPDVAARAMRASIISATSTWTSVHPSMLLRLSGGLDSSIIAGCLKEAPNKSKFVAYTYFSPRGRSDERPWAKLAAQHAGCEHIEYSITPAEMDLRLALDMQATPEPSPLLAYLQRTTVEQTIAAQSGATAIFNGEGGDSGFCSDSVAYAVPDFIRNHGIAPGIFRLASQVALLTEKSSWNVLASALRRHMSSGDILMPRERILAASQLVSADVRQSFQSSESFTHPWFQGDRGVPWDKIRRLGTLISTPEYYNVGVRGDEFAPEIISPLYAQPVIELLLRIPIYTHFNGGRDRGLARDAFTHQVPEPILRRLWKDRAPGFHEELLERHRLFLKETLLDGVLARSGLLDRRMLEEALSSGPTKSLVYPGELFRHLDSELWARHWLEGPRQQAAA